MAASTRVGAVYNTGQGCFVLDERDQFVCKQLIETGFYGQDEISILKTLCTSSTRMLLLGAHVGTLAVPISKFVGGIVAFEANPSTYQLLQLNLRLNGCTNVTAHNIAADHRNGSLQFVMNTVNSGGSKRLPVHRDPIYFNDDPEVGHVQARRLDDLLVDQIFDVIFMDIEGSEYFALKGMPNLLARASMVVCEFLPHHFFRVAGIAIDDFAECLEQFRTLIVPKRRDFYHDGDIAAALNDMANARTPRRQC